MRIPSIILGFSTLAFFLTPAMADHHMAKAIKIAKSSKGDVLTNAKSMTLYIFDKDKPGTSNCKGKCTVKWPPMPATAKSKNDGELSVVKRADGTFQWA